jgi:hypothetical protein
MENEPKLLPVIRGGKSTGFFKCSLCEIEFSPDLNKPGAMREEFTNHLFLSHSTPKAKKPREDVNQAAARVIREATERD